MLNEETRQYILAHAHEDVRTLALRGCKAEGVDFRFALQQIEGRQKARTKLPEFYENPDVLYPATISMEQCSSSLTAHYKAALVRGKRMADLSGGLGVDTFAFAQHFTECLHIEPNAELSSIAQHNAGALHLDNIRFHCSTMEEALDAIPFVDCIYLDPSRRDSHGNRVATLESCTPNLSEWKDTLMQKCQQLLVKLSPMIDIKRTLLQLPETREVHTVAVGGECKEVLFLLQHGGTDSTRIFKSVNITTKETQEYTFTEDEESTAVPNLAGKVERYLYEPNAAILKAGAFKSVSTRFHLQKLHPHTHLYTSENLESNFPGRTFEVQQTLFFNKKEIRHALREMKKANIAVRNFPLTAQELKKTLKLQDGGETFLFGATLSDGRLVLIETRKS